MTLDFDGEKYRRASSQQKTWGRKLISELDLEGNEHILDIGCGDGTLTAELAELVPDGFVLGLDASMNMIETARKGCSAQNLRFDLQDIGKISVESEFDVVFSNATLHWVKNHNKLLANVYGSLIDGGTARFQFGGDGNCSNLIAVLRETISQKDYAGYFENFEWPWYMPTLTQYRELLDRTAFAVRQLWSRNADKYFENVEAMVQWIDQPSLVPFLKQVDQRDRQRFRNVVVERMIERTKQGDGTCYETFRRVNVLARR
jgi:trans-aconitate methyltransferase